MNLASLEAQRASMSRQIGLMKTGRLKVNMAGETQALEKALANLDFMIEVVKRKLG
jgi:molybdopterin biosynthesis enzyme MoaB